MTSPFRADLHCHSNCSDGTDSPFALLTLAKEVGLSGLSITDHDTVQAYTPQLFKQATQLGIELLPGVEISAELDQSTVHILGYGFHPEDEGFRVFLKNILEKRAQRNRSILKKLKQHGVSIDEEELQALFPDADPAPTIGRPHIASLMIQKKVVSSFQEAFEKFLKEGACCYVSGVKESPQKVIEEIHRAQGKAVWAHPHVLKKKSLKKKLVHLPFDGIECHYSLFPPEKERPWLDLARKKKWIPTGGSDYHGKIKPQIRLGCSWVNEESFRKLASR